MSSINKFYKSYKTFLQTIDKNDYLYYKPLRFGNLKRKGGGRNNKGHITIRNRGNGIKRFYKNICFNYMFLYNFNF